jgi:hypothetical protein
VAALMMVVSMCPMTDKDPALEVTGQGTGYYKNDDLN